MNQSLDIALSGMRASQLAMDVAAHNVSNVNTAGYARQRVNLAARPGQVVRSALIGGGVEVASVQRISDRFIGRQIRQQLGEQGYYQAMASRLGDLENLFNDAVGNGLQQSFSDFYSGLAQVAAHPEDTGVRVTAINSAQMLAGQIQNARSQVAGLETENRLELGYAVQQVNENLQRLAQINGNISSAARVGEAVADLQNERDQILEQIATALPATVSITADDGVATVSVQGRSLVLGNQALTLEVNAGGLFITGSADPLPVGQGRIGAMLELRDSTLPGYLAQLDTLAGSLATEFNAVHSAGFGLDGSTGLNLFNGSNASNLTINPALLSHPEKFAASGTGQPGDLGSIQAMLALRESPTIGGVSHEDYYGQMIGGLAAQTQAVRSNEGSVGNILTALQNRRDSVSGVSLDEEMTDLIRFQQAYNAAARVISMIDEMYQTTVNLGR